MRILFNDMLLTSFYHHFIIFFKILFIPSILIFFSFRRILFFYLFKILGFNRLDWLYIFYDIIAVLLCILCKLFHMLRTKTSSCCCLSTKYTINRVNGACLGWFKFNLSLYPLLLIDYSQHGDFAVSTCAILEKCLVCWELGALQLKCRHSDLF